VTQLPLQPRRDAAETRLAPRDAPLFALALSLAAACSPGGQQPQAGAALDSCTRWATEICKQLEPDSELCGSLKQSAKFLYPAACQRALSDQDTVRTKLAERKQRCPELETRLCRELGVKSRACKTVREGTRQFSPERCRAMLEQYPKVLDELRQNAKANQLSPEKTAKLTAGDPPSFGPVDAKLQLVEFIDFENRDCVHAARIARQLRDKYGAQLRFVVRQFPLPYNPHAQLAAEAALAAHAQGKFWPYHDALLANQAQLDRASLERYATEVQLDAAQFKAALDQKQFTAAVAADKALGDELSVVGMPTMFLNGDRLPNAVDEEGVIAAIEERLAVP
jgi:protein-disulfide isomerase